ncbi:Spi family protease inhibitor [Dyadobacter sp. CY326]|uniref:Spi family protease inhibitor n=1 Tax=Dyadobacter sp. CY326 TaxID=2907300 RepID=UPI001F20C295|nr:Spi family protease inhibitor [Dyadobacter sp. CY326]MCE7063720.1 Spi family protease inhibitor [Dyadobacter sp. CY326]
MKIVLLLSKCGLLFCLAALIFLQCKRDEPSKDPGPETEIRKDSMVVSLKEAIEVATFTNDSATRIHADSGARTVTRDDEVVDQMTVTDSVDGSPLLYIFKKQRGFTIVSADLRVMPVLAYSATSTIDVHNIPNGITLWLDMAKTKIREARRQGGESHTIVAKEWQKFLSRKLRIADTNCIDWYQYGQFMCKNKMTLVGPLISTVWGQSALSTTKLSTAGNCDGCGRRLAGCGPVAMAQLEEFYHPDLTRPRVSELVCTATTAGQHSLGSLMKTMGDKAKASYNYMGSCNTFTWPNDVKSGLKSFGFSSGGSGNEAYNFALIKSELNGNHPLLFWGSTCLSCFKDYHIWVCEGYQLSDYSEFDCATKTCKEWSYTYLRMNCGWDGEGNGDFAFGQYNPDGEDYNGNLHVITGIRP